MQFKTYQIYRSAVSAQIDKECFPRKYIKNSTIFELVYRYLRKCADRDGKSKRRNKCACNKFYKQHERKKNIHERDAPTPRINFKEEFFGEQSKPHVNKYVLCKRTSRSSSKEYISDYTKAVRNGMYSNFFN